MGRDLKPLNKREDNLFHFRLNLQIPSVFDTMNKAYTIIKREGYTFSEFVGLTLTEYVDRHYEGQHATVLDSFTEDGVKSKAHIEAEIIKYFEQRYKNGWIVHYKFIIQKINQDLGVKGQKAVDVANQVIRVLVERKVPILKGSI